MSLKLALSQSLMAMLLSTTLTFAADAPYAGKFSDGTLTIELSEQGSGYVGTIALGQRKFPATAHADGNTLSGSFDSGGHGFPFTATLASDTMTLISGTKTYVLKNAASTAPNPLDDPANGGSIPPNAAPQTGPAAPADAPPGYEVMASTSAGQSLVTRKAKLTTVKAALEATFPDLAQFFGSRPVIGSAFQDAKNLKSGGATFTVTSSGQPMQGFVKCTLDDSGATVAVIYGQAKASKSEWDKLLNPPGSATAPAGDGAAVASAATDPAIPLKQYDFSDGTGSVGLAEGWTSKTQSAADPLVIVGPANQMIVINNGRTINLPDSQPVKLRQQMQQMAERTKAQTEANAKRMEKMTGRPAPRPNLPPPAPLPPLLVAPLLEPVEALKSMIPQFSAEAEFNHGSPTTLDQIISSRELPTQLQGGKAAEILYEYSTTLSGKPAHLRRMLRLTTAPLGTGAWFWYVSSGLAAPADTFDRDLPVMQAMVKSLNVNKDKLAQVAQERSRQMQETSRVMADANAKVMQTQREMFEDNQRTQANIHNQQMQQMQNSFHQHNVQWANDEWQKQRHAADVQEYILGSRTVYDTKTGQSTGRIIFRECESCRTGRERCT